MTYNGYNRKKTIIYINLTSGLEAIPMLSQNHELRIIRIPSSWCEQNDLLKIIDRLSDDLLFNLAIGNKCYIIDLTAKNKPPRTIRIGVEFIKFILTYIWYQKISCPSMLKGNFFRLLFKLKNTTITKVSYYKKFIDSNNTEINLHTMWWRTKNNDKYQYYIDLVKKLKQEGRI